MMTLAKRDSYGVTRHYNVVVANMGYGGWTPAFSSSHENEHDAMDAAKEYHSRTGTYCRVEYWGKSGQGSETILAEFGTAPEGIDV